MNAPLTIQSIHGKPPQTGEEKTMNSSNEGAGILNSGNSRFGFYSAIFTAVITLITFGFAITAIPISGENCVEGCVKYPYLDTASRFPQDFLWMPLAIIMILAYVTLMVSIHASAPDGKKIFSQMGLAFALMAATVLVSVYYIQFSVVPVSLMNHETDGLALLIQYNPHGVFIAMEELGYLMMSLSFLFMAPVFTGKNRLETAARWIFIAAFILTIIALVAISFTVGLERQDRFEIAVISIDWLALIINGVLLSLVFRRRVRQAEYV
jgi:hypothetical protein